jgi:hypothetical protein
MHLRVLLIATRRAINTKKFSGSAKMFLFANLNVTLYFPQQSKYYDIYYLILIISFSLYCHTVTNTDKKPYIAKF